MTNKYDLCFPGWYGCGKQKNGIEAIFAECGNSKALVGNSQIIN